MLSKTSDFTGLKELTVLMQSKCLKSYEDSKVFNDAPKIASFSQSNFDSTLLDFLSHKMPVLKPNMLENRPFEPVIFYYDLKHLIKAGKIILTIPEFKSQNRNFFTLSELVDLSDHLKKKENNEKDFENNKQKCNAGGPEKRDAAVYMSFGFVDKIYKNFLYIRDLDTMVKIGCSSIDAAILGLGKFVFFEMTYIGEFIINKVMTSNVVFSEYLRKR